MIYPPITYPPAPSDDDFDEAYEAQREAERDGGCRGGNSAAVSPSPEEDDRD